MKIKETDLAKIINDYFENIGLESYKEVSLKGKGGNIRCDSYIIKRQNDLIIDSFTIETKLNFSLKVIHQSYLWKNYSKRNYICIPKPKRKDMKLYNFSIDICKKMNIGIYIVDVFNKTVTEFFKPIDNNLNIKYPPLYEEQKKSEAGNDKSEYITSYKITIKNLKEFLIDKDWLDIKFVIENIKHHYKNNNSAINSIKKYIYKNIITDIQIQDNKIILKK